MLRATHSLRRGADNDGFQAAEHESKVARGVQRTAPYAGTSASVPLNVHRGSFQSDIMFIVEFVGKGIAMSNGFFKDHRSLGGRFDLDNDGSLDLGDAVFMGGVGSMYARELLRASREADRENDLNDRFYSGYDRYGNPKPGNRGNRDPWDYDSRDRDEDW